MYPTFVVPEIVVRAPVSVPRSVFARFGETFMTVLWLFGILGVDDVLDQGVLKA